MNDTALSYRAVCEYVYSNERYSFYLPAENAEDAALRLSALAETGTVRSRLRTVGTDDVLQTEWTWFACSYRYHGREWGMELCAESATDCAARLRTLAHAEVRGESMNVAF